MNSYVVATTVFGCVFLASLVGMSLNAILPETHRTQASHDVIKLSTGMISVLASLVLGLLIASVKGSFDTADSQMRSFAANLILLHQTLDDWGPETAKAHALLRDYTARSIEDHWPAESDHSFVMENRASGNVLDATRLAILQLIPNDPLQHDLRESAVTLMNAVLQTRWLLIEHAESSIEPVFLMVLVAWITLIFLSFGYNAPVNATVIVSFFICAGALAACLFVIVEMDGPFDGVIAISSQPMRNALAHMTP